MKLRGAKIFPILATYINFKSIGAILFSIEHNQDFHLLGIGAGVGVE